MQLTALKMNSGQRSPLDLNSALGTRHSAITIDNPHRQIVTAKPASTAVREPPHCWRSSRWPLGAYHYTRLAQGMAAWQSTDPIARSPWCLPDAASLRASRRRAR